jgi:hypothetical protein
MTRDVLSRFRIKLTNAILDLRFGTLLRGLKPTCYTQLGAYDTANSDYTSIRKLFRGRVQPQDVLVDVGCGKGRVINAWLLGGYSNRIICVEFDPQVAAETAARLLQFPNVSIIRGDIVTNFPDEGTIFYLYNPFNAQVMHKFKSRLKESLAKRSFPEATVIYYNCRHVEVFTEDDACEIQWGRLEHPFAIVRLRVPGIIGVV